LLNVRAAHTKDPAEAIADFIQARRVRKEVIAICERWLTANREPKGNEAAEGALKKYLQSKYWVLATLAEANVGLGINEEGQRRLDAAYAVASADWMKETTQKQLKELRPASCGFATGASQTRSCVGLSTPRRRLNIFAMRQLKKLINEEGVEEQLLLGGESIQIDDFREASRRQHKREAQRLIAAAARHPRSTFLFQ
jgi:hypothetical protein